MANIGAAIGGAAMPAGMAAALTGGAAGQAGGGRPIFPRVQGGRPTARARTVNDARGRRAAMALTCKPRAALSTIMGRPARRAAGAPGGPAGALGGKATGVAAVYRTRRGPIPADRAELPYGHAGRPSGAGGKTLACHRRPNRAGP